MILMEKRLKKRINWNILIMLCVYELFIVSFILILVYTIVEAEIMFDREFLAIPIIFILLGLFILNCILWQIKGYELIRINNETLTIRKKGIIFNIPEKLNLSQIKNIYLKEYKTTIFTLFLKIMGIEGGKICIDYSGNSIHFGQSLTDEEVLECINEINKFLSPANTAVKPNQVASIFSP